MKNGDTWADIAEKYPNKFKDGTYVGELAYYTGDHWANYFTLQPDRIR